MAFMNWGLSELFESQKTALPTDWSEDVRGRQSITAGLEINGATIEGLFLRITANRTLADREVMFQLEYRPQRGKGDSLCRIDWRPLRSHRNPNVGPRSFRMLEMTGSHHHSFELNFLRQTGQMRDGNLPLAEPLDEPSNFSDLLAVVSEKFRILGLNEIPLPVWDLLL